MRNLPVGLGGGQMRRLVSYGWSAGSAVRRWIPSLPLEGGQVKGGHDLHVLLRHRLLPQPGGFASGARIGHADGRMRFALWGRIDAAVLIDDLRLEDVVVGLLVRPKVKV